MCVKSGGYSPSQVNHIHIDKSEMERRFEARLSFDSREKKNSVPGKGSLSVAEIFVHFRIQHRIPYIF